MLQGCDFVHTKKHAAPRSCVAAQARDTGGKSPVQKHSYAFIALKMEALRTSETLVQPCHMKLILRLHTLRSFNRPWPHVIHTHNSVSPSG
jgi:hypothetical protein